MGVVREPKLRGMSFEDWWWASQVRGRGRGLVWLAPVRPDEESPATLGIVEVGSEVIQKRSKGGGALYGGGRIPSSI